MVREDPVVFTVMAAITQVYAAISGLVFLIVTSGAASARMDMGFVTGAGAGDILPNIHYPYVVEKITPPLSIGQDYVLEGRGWGDVYLLNPQGQANVAFPVANGDIASAQEFRAAYSASYTLGLHAVTNSGVLGSLFRDCRGDAKTQCQLALGGYQDGDIEARADRDWYRIGLVKGKQYRLTLYNRANGPVTLTLRNCSTGGEDGPAR